MSNPNPSPETRFKPGVSGNPSGRPKNPLKDFQRELFASMSKEDKIAFLEKIAPDMRWRMAEGNPTEETDITTGGDKLGDTSFTAEQIVLLKQKLKEKKTNG